MLLWRWFLNYRLGIIARAERDGSPNIGSVQMVMLPWVVPLIALTVLAVVLDPPEGIRQGIALAVGIPALIGMAYAGGTYCWASIKAERRKPRP